MNKSMLTVGIILLSLIALLLINIITNYSTGGELDYYLVKETTDAAIDVSIDEIALRDCGVPRIDRDRFVETFLYRFARSVDNTRTYDVYFYDINLMPPKVSVKVNSLTVLSFRNNQNKDEAPEITTNYDAIVESTYGNDIVAEEYIKRLGSDACKSYLSSK